MTKTIAIDVGVPRFEVVFPSGLAPEVDPLYRPSAPVAEIGAALFVGGARRTFSGNVMSIAKLLVREGEWVTRNSVTGLFEKAIATRATAWPIWQDPGAGRTDSPEGGMTYLMGIWSAATNMIDDGLLSDGIGHLSPGDELKVGLLPAGHEFEGATGLLPVDANATGTFFVVAHVEEVIDDRVAIVGNQNAHYFKTVTQVLTTPAPTTAP